MAYTYINLNGSSEWQKTTICESGNFVVPICDLNRSGLKIILRRRYL